MSLKVDLLNIKKKNATPDCFGMVLLYWQERIKKKREKDLTGEHRWIQQEGNGV